MPQLKSTPLVWGHIFEDTCRSVTQVLLNCNVHEAPGSIRSADGYISCSPDGIGIVRIPHKLIGRELKVADLKISRNKYDFSNVVNFAEPLKQYRRYQRINNSEGDKYSALVEQMYYNSIALFEFKSPYSRVLTNVVPQEYCYQVLCGLNVMSICKIGVYSESRFVTCLADQLDFSDSYLNFNTGGVDLSLEFHSREPFMVGCKFYVFGDVSREVRDSMGFTRIRNKFELMSITAVLEPVKDFQCIDCCFIRDDIYSSSRLLINFYNNISKYCEVDFDTLAATYWTYQTDGDISPLADLIRGPNVFAIQYWKLMDNRIAYFTRIADFAESQLPGAIEVVESVKLLAGRIDKRDILDDIPMKRAARGEILCEIVQRTA
jgi:hypothetical protein